MRRTSSPKSVDDFNSCHLERDLSTSRTPTRPEPSTTIFLCTVPKQWLDPQEHYLRVVLYAFLYAVINDPNLVIQGGFALLEDVTGYQEWPLKCHLLRKEKIVQDLGLAYSPFFVPTYSVGQIHQSLMLMSSSSRWATGLSLWPVQDLLRSDILWRGVLN